MNESEYKNYQSLLALSGVKDCDLCGLEPVEIENGIAMCEDCKENLAVYWEVVEKHTN